MKLQPFSDPTPPPPTACVCCTSFRAECLLPLDGGAVPACWLCAHAVAVHACAPHHAHVHECECTPDEIYPRGSAARTASVSGRLKSAAYVKAPESPQPKPDRVDAVVLIRDQRELLGTEPTGNPPAARALPGIAGRRLR